MAFNYPKHPLSDRHDPFKDERGKNPFGDDEPNDAQPIDDNAFASTGGASYRETGFQATLEPRSHSVFGLGVIGVSTAVIGGGGLLLALVAQGDLNATSFSFCALCLVIALITAWPAWLMGRADLAAMRMGAMEADDQRRTRWGHRLGLIGLLLCASPVAYLVFSIFRSLGEE